MGFEPSDKVFRSFSSPEDKRLDGLRGGRGGSFCSGFGGLC